MIDQWPAGWGFLVLACRLASGFGQFGVSFFGFPVGFWAFGLSFFLCVFELLSLVSSSLRIARWAATVVVVMNEYCVLFLL